MTNAEKIRSFSDTQLSNFLWIWGINTVTSFLEHGGQELMNAHDLRKWILADESTFVRTETAVGDDFTFDQSFNWKSGGES